MLKYLSSTKEEQIAEEDHIILVPEFDFPHGIFKIAYTELNVEGLLYAYNKLANFLNLRNNGDIGLTIIVTPSWMFVAQLTQPYHVESKRGQRDFPVYLDGLSYAGILNLQ